MQRLISLLVLLFSLTLLPVVASAGWFTSDALVTIDGTEYTNEDFKNWWKFWKEKDQSLPKTVDFYVDWLLLRDEAERIDLANAPGFKRQERVFLQSRGLLMLKSEEVDSRIDVTEEMIRTRYQEEYQPRWLVQQLTFTDETAALTAWQELNEGSSTFAQLRDRSVEDNGPEGIAESWMRPKGIDPGWIEIFRTTAVGKVVDPELHKNGKLLFYMKASEDGDDKDLAGVRDQISKNLWREEEDRLTAELIEKLTKKYQVKIDEERLAALDLLADDATFSDELIISTNVENVSEKQFVQVIRSLQKSRPTLGMILADEEKVPEFKLDTVQNIINQSVTNWASLDRHFEKEEPFKSLYDFNYGYRLVQTLEKQLFSLNAEPTGEELEKLYQEKAQFYKVPAQAKLYVIDDKLGPIDKIWAEVAVGKQFNLAVKEILRHPVQPMEVPVNHLDSQILAMVDKLAEGETSQIFEAQGGRVLVHLVSRTREQVLPLEQIKKSLISGYKRESFDMARAAYLKELRANAKIEVDEENWKTILKELGGA